MKGLRYIVRLVHFFAGCTWDALKLSWKIKGHLFAVAAFVVPILLNAIHPSRITLIISLFSRYWFAPVLAYLLIFVGSFVHVVYKTYEDAHPSIPKDEVNGLDIESTDPLVVDTSYLLQVRITNKSARTIRGIKLQLVYFNHKEVMKYLNHPLDIYLVHTQLNPGEYTDSTLFSCRGFTDNVTLSLILPNAMYDLFDLSDRAYETRILLTAEDTSQQLKTLWVTPNPPAVFLSEQRPPGY